MIDLPLEVAGIPVWAQDICDSFFSTPSTFLLVLSHLAFGAYHRSLYKWSFRLKWRIKINALSRPTQAPGEKLL